MSGRALACTLIAVLAGATLLQFAFTREPQKGRPTPATVSAPHATATARTPSVRGKETAASGEEERVRHVIDGDTVVLSDGRVVRYIGVDAPETGAGRPRECFADQATARNRELVEGKPVRLERDISEHDKYGRLLRYVYVGALFVNEALILEGYASALAYPPDVRYIADLRRAEAAARGSHRGLWGEPCGRGPAPRKDSARRRSTDETRHAAGPDDKDCTDFAAHAEAQAFFEAQGGPASDPHHLDQDRDGLACEGLP